MPEVAVNLQVLGLPETANGEPPPIEYELVHEQIFEPEASTYTGEAEVCTMFFDAPPEQIPFLEQIVTTLTDAIVTNIIAEDGKMLRLRIYNAKGEWYNSKWKVEAVCHASPLAWGVIIPLILVAVIAIAFVLVTYNIKTMDWTGQAVIGAGLGLGILLVVVLLAMAGGKKGKKGGK